MVNGTQTERGLQINHSEWLLKILENAGVHLDPSLF